MSILAGLKTNRSRLLVSLVLLAFSSHSFSQEFNKNAQGVLVHGFDVVSYFGSMPQKGSRKFSYNYEGSTLYFASKANLKKFKQQPSAYLPMFGGFCAYGVRMGKKFDIDPLAYAIEDKRLYLLLNRSTKLLWEQERNRNIVIANKNWIGIMLDRH